MEWMGSLASIMMCEKLEKVVQCMLLIAFADIIYLSTS